mmetsp:Transcript_20424/g.34219  ORF Transcript_20424/g.34219 Transcript_20424/m.34219 type:complete len:140 (+) Transcript_20424:459-878(+)
MLPLRDKTRSCLCAEAVASYSPRSYLREAFDGRVSPLWREGGQSKWGPKHDHDVSFTSKFSCKDCIGVLMDKGTRIQNDSVLLLRLRVWDKRIEGFLLDEAKLFVGRQGTVDLVKRFQKFGPYESKPRGEKASANSANS